MEYVQSVAHLISGGGVGPRSAAAGGAALGARRAAGDRRGDAERVGSGLPAGVGLCGRGAAGDVPAGPVGGDDGAGGVGSAVGPVLLRGFSAAQAGGAAPVLRAPGRRAAHQRVLRGPAPAGRGAGRCGRGAGRGPAGGGVPGTFVIFISYKNSRINGAYYIPTISLRQGQTAKTGTNPAILHQKWTNRAIFGVR